MAMRESIKRFIRDYFVIYTGCILGTLVYCTFFSPEEVFDLSYFRWMMIFALLGDLPIFVFCSSKELTGKQMLLRTALHFLLLESILLPTAHYLGFYQTAGQGAAFALIVLGVYILVKTINYRGDFKTAMEINEKLKEKNANQ